MKLKVLPSSLREKKRYILFKVISESPIEYSDLESAIWNTLLDFLGEYGTSKISAWLLKDRWENATQTCIIRCNHLFVPTIIATLGLIERLGDTRVCIKILKVSGTIKGCKKIQQTFKNSK
ncbi:MAG: ribonuclease P protein component 2 [Candidatus Aenigmarchaeota archaeon]|nr:ribonuclease P protein component 2 [Candidatus Aenigmarchaeota archaeon]MCX8179221.1 ribonuclease P protein component 2 [Candidatus Aenigmarchaeota archaeon]